MKTINQFLLSTVLVVMAFCYLSVRVDAITISRASKPCKTVSYSTAVSSVTSMTVAQSTGGMTSPGAIYSVLITTGAIGDYIVLLDTTNATGIQAAAVGVYNTSQVGPRLFVSSTSVNTQFIFDPPMQFYNGLMAQSSNNLEQYTICYETGRGLGD